MSAPLPKELRDYFARFLREGLNGREGRAACTCWRSRAGDGRGKLWNTGAATVAPMGRPQGPESWTRMLAFRLNSCGKTRASRSLNSETYWLKRWFSSGFGSTGFVRPFRRHLGGSLVPGPANA